MDAANVAMDAFCIVLCGILGTYTLATDARRDRIVMCFVGICFSNALMALGDLMSWILVAPLSPAEVVALKAFTFVFYAATVPIFLFFSEYIVEFLRRKGIRSKGYLKISLVLFGLYLAGCVASLVGDGFFFRVTPDGGYERGAFFMLAQPVPIILHFRNAFLIVRHRARLSARELAGFASYIALPMIAEVIQVASFGIALMNPFIAWAVLLVFLGIQADRRLMLLRKEKELAEARTDIMMSQIKPHFLYNSLTAIRELCLVDPRDAADAITDFSLFLRENMASLTSRDPIPFRDELRHVRTYLNLEQRRFGERLAVDFDIRAQEFSVPSLSLQVLVENAVKHGVTKREEGGRIVVSTYQADDGCRVVVRDTGVGVDVSRLSDAAADGQRQSVGLANVRARLDAMGATLSIESEPGRGTCATMSIPDQR